MNTKPVAFVWHAASCSMIAVERYKVQARRQFEDGHEYILEPVGFRNMKSHSHYFAWLHEAWLNLPEDVAKLFPSEEHLRHTALVKTGFCNETNHPCQSNRLAKNLATIIRRRSPFAVIKVTGDVVQVWDAMSQAVPAMKPDVFQASKTAVMDWVAALNPGLSQEDLNRKADEHAPRSRPKAQPRGETK